MAKIKFKTMSVKSIYQELVNIGYDVKIYKRKDGGYLIRQIGSKKFAGASGNIYARQMLKLPKEQGLSYKKQAQLGGITRLRGTTKDFKQLYKETRDMWNKAKAKGQLKAEGKITPQSVMGYYQMYGEEEAKKALYKKQRYAEGLAYIENIVYFVEQLKRYRMDIKANGWHLLRKIDSLINFLNTNKENIREENLSNAIHYFYIYNQNKTKENMLTALNKCLSEFNIT